jgi:hypothetical protein
MGVMNRGSTTGDRPAQARIAIATVALALLGFAAPAPLAAAEPAPAESGSPVYETPSYEAPEPMVVGFATKSAKISGPGAIVSVRCTGTAAGSCDGTLSLHLGGGTHKVPYTIAAGAREIVVVPLGDPSKRAWRRQPRTGVAVTRTVQPLGGLVRSSRLLHLR